MDNIIKPELFARYSEQKYQQFQQWLRTPHGQKIYALFVQFSQIYKDAGHLKCGGNLIGNRLRWETGVVGAYQGYKLPNDYIPLLARQAATDHEAFRDFYTFHGKATG